MRDKVHVCRYNVRLKPETDEILTELADHQDIPPSVLLRNLVIEALRNRRRATMPETHTECSRSQAL